LANVAVHPSAFPETVERDLLQSFRSRRVDPKFHYTTYKQSRKWLALHESYSPSRTDDACAAIYDRSFKAAAKSLKAPSVRVIGLGCGGGQKDARLLSILAGQGTAVSYVPCDISLALVLTSLQAAEAALPGTKCDPLVCDLTHAIDLPQFFNLQPGARLFAFFGMIPNFDPETILPRLTALLGPEDYLLFSANLAPGPDYRAGVQHVLPGYDNPQTRDWLATFLQDLGVEPGDGVMEFSIEQNAAGIQRIVADYKFTKRRVFTVHGEEFKFVEGDKIRLFFSYRYTPDRIVALLSHYKLSTLEQFIAPSGEEGVFLCNRAGGQ